MAKYGDKCNRRGTAWYQGFSTGSDTAFTDPAFHGYGGYGSKSPLVCGNLLHNLRRDPYGHSTSKIAPYWEPADEKRYPFATWLLDLDLWCAKIELATAPRT